MYIRVDISPKKYPHIIWPPAINRVEFSSNIVPNVITIKDRTWKYLQSEIAIFQCFGQENLKNQRMRFNSQLVVDTEMQRTWFYIPICIHTHIKWYKQSWLYIYANTKKFVKKTSFTIIILLHKTYVIWVFFFRVLECQILSHQFNNIDVVLCQW